MTQHLRATFAVVRPWASPTCLLLAASLLPALPAWADVPPELARFVWTDSPDALVQVVGEQRVIASPGTTPTLDSPNADALTIEVIAPATATVRVGLDVHSQSFSPRGDTPADIPIGTAPEGDVPQDVEYDPDGQSFYILHRATRNIIQFDAATNTPIREFPLAGQVPIAMELTPDGSRFIVAYFTQDQLGFVDTTTGAETLLATGDAPGTIDITPGGAFAIVGCVMDSTLRVIDLATQTEVRSIPSPQFTQTISFGVESGVVDLSFPSAVTFLDATRLIFPGRFDSLVAIIDFTTGARNNIPTLASPAGAAVNAAGTLVAVSHASNNGITSIIDPGTLSVLRTINSPGGNTWANGPIVLNAAGTKAVVALQNSARVLDLATDTYGPALNTSNLENLLLNTAGTRVIGVGFSGAVIDLATGNLLARANDAVSCTRGAISPIADRAVLISWPTFGDDVVVMDTDATPARLYYGRTAPDPEGDISRAAAVSPSGDRAVSHNLFSANMTIISTATGSVQGYATTDKRPGEVEVTPDGAKAVACNLDGVSVSVVDLATRVTTAVPSATRIAQVEIDPAGSFAYVAQVASGDGVRKLNLATNTFVGGLLATGDMGGVGYAYFQNSQIALSPDGSLLAVPGAFNDRLDIVNTATMTTAQTFTPFGTFITRASWTPDGNTLLVSDRDADQVHVFRRANATSPFALAGAIATGDQPYDTLALATNDRAFVLNFGTPYSVGVLNLSTLAMTSTVPLPRLPVGMALSADGQTLKVLTVNEQTTLGLGGFTRVVEGELTLINTATLAVTETIATSQTASMLAANADATVLAASAMSSEVLTLITPQTGCDSIDFNHDGLFPDTQDIDDFLAVFAGQPCSNDPNCGDIDFNNDGLFPDTLDIDALLSVFSGSPCLR